MVKDNLISEIVCSMVGVINEEQLITLKENLIVKMNNYDVSVRCTELSVLTIDEINNKALMMFQAELIIQKKSLETIKQYIRETQALLNFTQKSYKDITKADLTTYLLFKQKNGLAQTTVLNVRRFTKPFFDWLVANEYITKNPFINLSKIKPPAVKKIILNNSEVEKIRDACKTEFEIALVDFLLSTGLRVGELTSLCVDDVDFTTGHVSVFAKKTNTYRTVCLDAKALKHLIDYRNTFVKEKLYSTALFPNKYGKHMSSKHIEQTIHKIAEKAGVKKHVTVHTFRKTFASQLFYRGCSPITISILMGHKDFNTTSKYYCNFNKDDVIAEFLKCCG